MKNDDELKQIYGLGVVAGTLLMHQPEGWKRKFRANLRRAQKLGVQVDLPSFNDVAFLKLTK